MKKLGDMADGRDNNLNLIRLCAALAVLVSHAWPIAGGPGTTEPLQNLSGITLGTYAVMVFFGLSGFLITGSWLRDTDPWRFCIRRARRIVPGLVVCLAVTAFCLGPVVSDHSVQAYFQDTRTWSFLVVNGTMVGFQGDLPGVFQAIPYPAVAGSIWTLHYEMLCYCLVLCAGVSGLLKVRHVALLSLGTAAMVSVLAIASHELMPTRILRLAELFLPFACGSAAWFCRDKLPLSPIIFAAFIAGAIGAFGSVLQPLANALAITYGTLLIGFGRSLQLTLPGDYSYGVYIYAFPVQGLVMHLSGSISPWANIAISTPITLVLAAVSWHLIEQPCIRRKTVSKSAGASAMIARKV